MGVNGIHVDAAALVELERRAGQGGGCVFALRRCADDGAGVCLLLQLSLSRSE